MPQHLRQRQVKPVSRPCCPTERGPARGHACGQAVELLRCASACVAGDEDTSLAVVEDGVAGRATGPEADLSNEQLTTREYEILVLVA
jgi:hypothetical protein